MFEIKIEGLDKATRHLDELSRKARALAGEHKIPVPEGMTEEQAVEAWLQQHFPNA